MEYFSYLPNYSCQEHSKYTKKVTKLGNGKTKEDFMFLIS